jgi:hypothetical protein
VAVPKRLPVTLPVTALMLAHEGLLLLQVPPVVASDKTDGTPIHKAVLPVMAEGSGFTVSIVDDVHPRGNV